MKQEFLEILQNSQKSTCARAFFLNFINKETLAQVFSLEFYEISKNAFFTEHLWTTASEQLQKVTLCKIRTLFTVLLC